MFLFLYVISERQESTVSESLKVTAEFIESENSNAEFIDKAIQYNRFSVL